MACARPKKPRQGAGVSGNRQASGRGTSSPRQFQTGSYRRRLARQSSVSQKFLWISVHATRTEIAPPGSGAKSVHHTGCRPDTRCPPLGRKRAQGIGGKPTAQRGRRIIGCTPRGDARMKKPRRSGAKSTHEGLPRGRQIHRYNTTGGCTAHERLAPVSRPRQSPHPRTGGRELAPLGSSQRL